jgi:hypothetical protein
MAADAPSQKTKNSKTILDWIPDLRFAILLLP